MFAITQKKLFIFIYSFSRVGGSESDGYLHLLTGSWCQYCIDDDQSVGINVSISLMLKGSTFCCVFRICENLHWQ